MIHEFNKQISIIFMDLYIRNRIVMMKIRFIRWMKKHRNVPTTFTIIKIKSAPRRDMLDGAKFFNLSWLKQRIRIFFIQFKIFIELIDICKRGLLGCIIKVMMIYIIWPLISIIIEYKCIINWFDMISLGLFICIIKFTIACVRIKG